MTRTHLFRFREVWAYVWMALFFASILLSIVAAFTASSNPDDRSFLAALFAAIVAGAELTRSFLILRSDPMHTLPSGWARSHTGNLITPPAGERNDAASLRYAYRSAPSRPTPLPPRTTGLHQATIRMYELLIAHEVVGDLRLWGIAITPQLVVQKETLDDLVDGKIVVDPKAKDKLSISSGGPPYQASSRTIKAMTTDYKALRAKLLEVLKEAGITAQQYLDAIADGRS